MDDSSPKKDAGEKNAEIEQRSVVNQIVSVFAWLVVFGSIGGIAVCLFVPELGSDPMVKSGVATLLVGLLLMIFVNISHKIDISTRLLKCLCEDVENNCCK